MEMKNSLNDEHEFAGFWKRSLAFVIDLAAYLSLMLSFVFFLELVTPADYPAKGSALESVFIVILLIAPFLGYFVLAAYFLGGTYGKRILGLRIVSQRFEKPGFWQLLLRETIGKALSGITWGIGYLMVGLSQEKKALHDLIAKTYVIDVGVKEKRYAATLSIVIAIFSGIVAYAAVTQIRLEEMTDKTEIPKIATDQEKPVKHLAEADVSFGDTVLDSEATLSFVTDKTFELTIRPTSAVPIRKEDVKAYVSGTNQGSPVQIADGENGDLLVSYVPTHPGSDTLKLFIDNVFSHVVYLEKIYDAHLFENDLAQGDVSYKIGKKFPLETFESLPVVVNEGNFLDYNAPGAAAFSFKNFGNMKIYNIANVEDNPGFSNLPPLEDVLNNKDAFVRSTELTDIKQTDFSSPLFDLLLIPPTNATTGPISHVKFIDNENFSGVRFVYLGFFQDRELIGTSEDPAGYVFYGKTKDGKHEIVFKYIGIESKEIAKLGKLKQKTIPKSDGAYEWSEDARKSFEKIAAEDEGEFNLPLEQFDDFISSVRIKSDPGVISDKVSFGDREAYIKQIDRKNQVVLKKDGREIIVREGDAQYSEEKGNYDTYERYSNLRFSPKGGYLIYQVGLFEGWSNVAYNIQNEENIFAGLYSLEFIISGDDQYLIYCSNVNYGDVGMNGIVFKVTDFKNPIFDLLEVEKVNNSEYVNIEKCEVDGSNAVFEFERVDGSKNMGDVIDKKTIKYSLSEEKVVE